MNAPIYTLTNESLTVIVDGQPHTCRKGDDNFEAARAAVFAEDWENLPSLLSVGLTIERWLKGKGDFKVRDNLITYKGEPVDGQLNERMLRMAKEGADPSGWLKFWERLQANPSYRSVHQLYAFLAHEGIPVDEEDGFILAYKSVTSDYKDFHTRTFDNRPGVTNEMPRNKISDDPKVACHEGFHVGALKYAQGFGDNGKRIVICKVDPADVVCVPYDCSAMKVRVCKYTVIGNFSGQAFRESSFRDDEDAPPLYPPSPLDEDTDEDTGDWEEDEDTGDWTPDEDTDDGEYEDEDTGDGEERETVAESIALAEASVTGASPPPVPAGSPWAEYDAMGEEELSKVLFPDLRKYARHALLIIGASKMQGSKLDLVKRILEVRTKRDAR